MSTDLNDVNSAARLREAVAKICRDIVEQMYPRPRYATVTAVNTATRKVTCQYPDEAGTFVVTGTEILPPVGSVVRIAGLEGARYVDEITNLGVILAPSSAAASAILTLPASTHATSEYVGVVVGPWTVGNDVGQSGAQELFVYHPVLGGVVFMRLNTSTGWEFAGTVQLDSTVNCLDVINAIGFTINTRAAWVEILRGRIASTADVTNTTSTAADITGATTGALSLKAGDVVEITGTFHMAACTAGIGALGTLDIGGTEQAGTAVFVSTSTTNEATVSQTWTYTVPSTANYTFKLRCKLRTTTNTMTVKATNTTIKYAVFAAS